MHNTTFALVLLSLFTTADKAAEIEGDLLEQSRRHGRLWFWLQVLVTVAALFFHMLRQDMGKLLLMAYAIYELALKLSWWVLVPLTSKLRRGLRLDAPQESVYDLIVTTCAFGFGMLIVRLAPRHGALLVMLAGAMLLGRVTLLDGGSAAAIRFIGLILTQAVLGAVLMKWLELRHGSNAAHASH